MYVKDIMNAIEEFAPSGIQEKWDNSGLCIGSESAETKSVLIGLDCTEELVDEAIRTGADMIVTHHPLIFSGLRSISTDNPVGAAVIKAIKADISVYAAHTNADKVIGGVSGAMATRLGLKNVSIIDEEEGGTGLGIIGDWTEPKSAKEAIAFVKKKFSLAHVRTSRPVNSSISRVAVCGGSGSSLIDKAFSMGASLYICADISYHHFFTRPDFMLMDIGHYESEVDVVGILFSVIKKKFPKFAVRITENSYSNPVYYF